MENGKDITTEADQPKVTFSDTAAGQTTTETNKTESVTVESAKADFETPIGESSLATTSESGPINSQCFELEVMSEGSNPAVEDGSSTGVVGTPDENQSHSPPPLLPSIHIEDEFGQRMQLDSNNNQTPFTEPASPPVDLADVAVYVKNINFSYSKKNNVLTNVTMTVPRGKIFALLGSSGCGKTTLLRIILGRIEPRRGEVRVFGAVPGSVHCNIPGTGVGYMPQELALMTSFTIEETLYYYGTLHNMTKEEIREKTDFYISLLNLPPKSRRISQCSGGQQRRVSVATTLFHAPPLLILDEPTVGVDPLLRCKIWEYLQYLCVNNGMTVIITTHYIEESRNAATLAFMRFGRILAQESPDTLLARHNSTVLEDVFLKLCQVDCGEIKQKYSVKKKRNDRNGNENGIEGEKVRSRFHQISIKRHHLKALFYKNITNLKRNPMLMLFFLILPVIQITLFCSSLYKKPDNLPITIYNGDNKVLSKRFLSLISPKMLRAKYCSSPQDAIQAVIEGKSWSAVTLSTNFTKAYRRRAKNPTDLSEEDFRNSKIQLYMDTSDALIHKMVFESLLDTYQSFVENVAESFGFNRASVRMPIYTHEVVYGRLQAGFDIMTDLSSGAMIAIIYTTPLIMAAFVLVLERKNNLLERTFVSGATSVEVFLTHLSLMMLVLTIQVALLMLVTFSFYNLVHNGSLYEVYILIYLQGVCGLFFGFFISSVSKNEMVAVLLSFGMIFPMWMMTGVFWPLESIVTWMQKIFWTMPLSYPIRAVNCIIIRGWTYRFWDIQLSYIISVGYNCALFFFNLVLFHITSK